MHITIEEIDGRRHTVVWYGSEGLQWSKIGVNKWTPFHGGFIVVSTQLEPDYGKESHIATALSALPKNPKPEDAPLLYKYASEGLMPCVRVLEGNETKLLRNYALRDLLLENNNDAQAITITHCINPEGNKVEVAIHEND